MFDDERCTLANAVTASRLFIAVPAMLLCTAVGARELFVWVLGASFLSDAVDGTLARLTGQVTHFGAVLDSWADVSAYCAIAIGVTVMWPSLLYAEWPACVTIVVAFLAPALAGLLKFGAFTSYHTLLVKIAVGTTAVALMVALVDGPRWPLRLAALFALLAAVEEITITLLLDELRSNVSGAVALWRTRRSVRHE